MEVYTCFDRYMNFLMTKYLEVSSRRFFAQFGFFLDFQLTSGNRGGNQAIFPPKICPSDVKQEVSMMEELNMWIKEDLPSLVVGLLFGCIIAVILIMCSDVLPFDGLLTLWERFKQRISQITRRKETVRRASSDGLILGVTTAGPEAGFYENWRPRVPKQIGAVRVKADYPNPCVLKFYVPVTLAPYYDVGHGTLCKREGVDPKGVGEDKALRIIDAILAQVNGLDGEIWANNQTLTVYVCEGFVAERRKIVESIVTILEDELSLKTEPDVLSPTKEVAEKPAN